MTRQEAIEAAAALMIGQDFGNACLTALKIGQDFGNAWLTALDTANWGKLAAIVLDKTGRTDLADAIWEGR